LFLEESLPQIFSKLLLLPRYDVSLGHTLLSSLVWLLFSATTLKRTAPLSKWKLT
jgi:hypothetical protein